MSIYGMKVWMSLKAAGFVGFVGGVVRQVAGREAAWGDRHRLAGWLTPQDLSLSTIHQMGIHQ